MNRKLVCLILMLVLMMSIAVYAEGVSPSKTSSDMTQMTLPSDLPPDFDFHLEDETDFSREQYEMMQAFVDEGGSIIDYFPPETIDEIKSQLPDGFDPEGLGVDEIVAFEPPTVCPPNWPDITIKFEFPRKYKVRTVIVTLVGCEQEEDETQWFLAPNEIDDDGSVDITFTTDLLTKIAGGKALLTVLGEAPTTAE